MKCGLRSVIVSPTRELATQTHRELRKLTHGKKWKLCLLTKATAHPNVLGPKSEQKFGKRVGHIKVQKQTL